MDITRDPLEIRGLTDTRGKPLLMPFDPVQWHEQFYPEVLAHRWRVKEATKHNDRASKIALDANKALCAEPGMQGMAYFANTFGWILEPRNKVAMMRLPFITFPRQIELMEDYDRAIATPAPDPMGTLAIIKARSVGGTWIDVLHNIKEWLFAEYWFSLVISKDEDLVTNLKDPKSYFWKMKFLLTNMDPRLLPEGFRGFKPRDPHTIEGTLENPVTGSIINGSTTTPDAGRGDRRGKVTMDEAGTYDDFDAMYSNLANVTDFRVIITSAHTRHGLGVYNLVHGKDGYTRPRVFIFNWNDVPGRGRKWFVGMQATMKKEEFDREVLMDWFSGTGEFVYNVLRHKQTGHFPFMPGWPTFVSMDDGWSDKYATSWWQKDLARGRWRCIAAYTNHGKSLEFYGYLLTGTPNTKYRWTAEELALMEWIREYGVFNATYYGDRHGDNTELTSGKSPFQVLQEDFGIPVITAKDSRRNDVKFRIDAVKEQESFIDIDDEHGAPLMLEAFQTQRWPKPRESSQSTSEPKRPRESTTRHLAVTAEYLFINELKAYGQSGTRKTVRTRQPEYDEQGMGFHPTAYHRPKPDDEPRYTQRQGVYVRGWNG